MFVVYAMDMEDQFEEQEWFQIVGAEFETREQAQSCVLDMRIQDTNEDMFFQYKIVEM